MSSKSKRRAFPAGETVESFFGALGQREEVYAAAVKDVLAWQMEKVRKERHITKSVIAARMGTSRSQVERILDPKNAAVSLEMLAKAAHAVGKKLKIELADPEEISAI